MIIRFRSNEDPERMFEKVRKMKRVIDEIEECLEEASNEAEYRTFYHKEYEDEEYENRPKSRYGYNYPRR